MRPGLCILLILFVAALVPVEAGTQYEVRCTRAGCGFVTRIGLHGGFAFEEASGYCNTCGKVVSVSWKRGGKKKNYLGKARDPYSGAERDLFKCPGCKSPFLAIDSIEEFRNCPKCGGATLTSRRVLMYD